jgi:hypothetical protein
MAGARVGARVDVGEAVSTRFLLAGVSAVLLVAAGVVGVAVQAPPLERVGTIQGSAGVLAAAGDLLIAGAGTGVRIVDVSRPAMATVTGRHDFDQPVLDLAVGPGDERVVFVANSHDGLRRLDDIVDAAGELRRVGEYLGDAPIAPAGRFAGVAIGAPGCSRPATAPCESTT